MHIQCKTTTIMLNGKAIAKLRKFKGYYQKELANAMDVCQQAVSKLEQRKHPVNDETFTKLLQAMDISATEWKDIKQLFTPPPAK